MCFERVTCETASEVSHIYALAWKTAYRGIVPQSYLDELPLDCWTPKLGCWSYQDYALKAEGRFVATSTIAPARDETMPGWGEVISLYVLPEQFHKGYGSRMLRYVTERLREQGFDKLYLWVLEQNHNARRFYEKMGFQPNGDWQLGEIGGKKLVEVRYVHIREKTPASNENAVS